MFAFAASANPPLFRASLWHRWGQALPAAYGGWESNLLRSLTKSFRPAIHICMEAFRQWLIQEERQALDPVVVQSYDRAFQAELEKLIQRARSNGTLRQSLESMRQCPVRTANGCTGWTDYIIGALLRNCPRTVDLDQAVSYIVFRMLGTRGERRASQDAVRHGPSTTLRYRDWFAIDGPLPHVLMHDLRSLCGGKVRRVLATMPPPRTVSITLGHRWADQAAGTVAADEIPDRLTEYEALLRDIMDVLARQSTPDLPLLDVFRSMLHGENLQSLRHRIGHTRADRTKKAVYQVIEDYAARTGNLALQNLLIKYREHKPDPTARRNRPKATEALGAASAPGARLHFHSPGRPGRRRPGDDGPSRQKAEQMARAKAEKP